MENDLLVYLTIFVYPSIHLCIYLPLPSNEVEVYQLPPSVMAIHGGQNAPGQPQGLRGFKSNLQNPTATGSCHRIPLGKTAIMLISIHNIRYMKPWEILRQLPVAIGFWWFDLNPLKPYGWPGAFANTHPNLGWGLSAHSPILRHGQDPNPTARPKGRILRQLAVAIGFCLFCL